MVRAKDDSKLSTNPKTIRSRLRRNGGKATRDLELLQQHGGMKPLELWDMEELARGKPRRSDGKFGGASPVWLTPAIMLEAKRRFISHTFSDLAVYATKAVKVIVKIMEDPDTDDKLRYQAATFIIEHVIGRAPARVEMEVKETTRDFLADILMVEDKEGNIVPAYPHVIQGEWTEDDDDEGL